MWWLPRNHKRVMLFEVYGEQKQELNNIEHMDQMPRYLRWGHVIGKYDQH